MSRTIAVILAGTLRAFPLREALRVPEFCLPVGPEGLLTDAWAQVLHELGDVEEAIIVVHDHRELALFEHCLPRRVLGDVSMRIMAEPTAWRGTGGILRDVTSTLAGDDRVLALEGACLPPSTLRPLVDAMERDPALSGVVGTAGDREPAGACVFTRAALEQVPPVGYHDVKEQLLPLLHGRQMIVTRASLGGEVFRIRDRRTYLSAVRSALGSAPGPDGLSEPCRATAANTSVSSSAVFEGFSLVLDGVVVEDGAVVHDSVIMPGATIGGGAVVSRSIIGPATVVGPRSHVVREIQCDRPATTPAVPARERGVLVG